MFQAGLFFSHRLGSQSCQLHVALSAEHQQASPARYRGLIQVGEE